MSDSQPEKPKDWMEIWYETGDITWQKPLSPEAETRIKELFERLTREQAESTDADEGGE